MQWTHAAVFVLRDSKIIKLDAYLLYSKQWYMHLPSHLT